MECVAVRGSDQRERDARAHHGKREKGKAEVRLKIGAASVAKVAEMSSKLQAKERGGERG